MPQYNENFIRNALYQNVIGNCKEGLEGASLKPGDFANINKVSLTNPYDDLKIREKTTKLQHC